MRWTSLSLVLAAAAAPALHAQAGAGTRPELTTQVIAARAVPATVTIVTFGTDGDTLGMGSGFLVRASGVVVTNHHVMAGATAAAVILTSGERYERVEALDSDPDADLAVLKIPGYGLPVLPTSAALPPVGARLVAVGNPLGLARTVSEGIVSAVRLVDGRQLLQMSVPISPGSSGGPVLNAEGQVVAVATKYLQNGQSLNFAVPVRYAMGLVDAGRRPVALAEAFGGAMNRPASAAEAVDRRSPAGEKRPPRTATPRSTIVGTYFVQQKGWVTPYNGARMGPLTSLGLLLFGAHDNGFLLSLSGPDTANLKASVYSLTSLVAAPDGRVVAELGGSTWTGYQTDDGLFLESARGPKPGEPGVELHLSAEHTTLELAARNGLYDLQVRTAYTLEGRHVEYIDWTGDAALVLANDSVFVDLWLENTDGGNVGTFAAGPIDANGSFDLVSSRGKSLRGRLRAGRFTAEWVDPRDRGVFRGTLEGRHR